MSRRLLFFDGACLLCNRFALFLLRHDRREQLFFAPLQGRLAREKLPASLREKQDTVVLLVGGSMLLRSRAVIEALRGLGGPWRLAVLLRVVPVPLLDFLYDQLAKRRQRWAGTHCRAPEPRERARFLE